MITPFNLNQYLFQNKSTNACGHTTRNLRIADFEKKGTLDDDRLIHLSYRSIVPPNENEIPISCYPYQACEVWECKICAQVVFFFMNDGGIAPRPEYILADYTKTYTTEPCSIEVFLLANEYDQLLENFPKLGTVVPVTAQHEWIKYDQNQPFTICGFTQNTTDVRFGLIGPYNFILEVVGEIKKLKTK